MASEQRCFSEFLEGLHEWVTSLPVPLSHTLQLQGDFDPPHCSLPWNRVITWPSQFVVDCAVPTMRSKSILRRLWAVFGWILYCLGWIRIFQITPRREPVTFVLFLLSAAIILFVIVHSWIAHNKRLAARGTRGRMTRYTPPSYSVDRLGRTLVFEASMASAREVLVAINGDDKIYGIAGYPETSSQRPGTNIEAGVKA